METLYDVLGIDATADSETIRRAYREQAKRHHPDVSESSAEKFRRLTTARDVLLDDAQRKRYDALGHRRYARYHLGDEWPVEPSAPRRTGAGQRSRRRGAAARADRSRRTRRTRRKHPPRRSGPADGLIALSTYWPLLVRAGVVLAALLVLAILLAAL
jgi:DnaJ-class molecular chaperone